MFLISGSSARMHVVKLEHIDIGTHKKNGERYGFQGGYCCVFNLIKL